MVQTVPPTIERQADRGVMRQVVPIGNRRGTYVILEAALPGMAARNIGVLLLDPATDRGWVRLRPGFDDLTDDTEVLDALEADLRGRIAEQGAGAFLAALEDSLSNTLRVSGRREVPVDAFTRVLEQLYTEHVEEARVQPFV